MPPTPSYWQISEPAAAKQSPHRVAAPDTSVESPKSRHSSSKSEPPWGTGHGSNISTLKCPIPHPPRNPLILRNQPWTAQQSLCRPAVPGSMATCPLPPQSQTGQMKESSWDRLHYGQHHPPCLLQHNGCILQSDGFP